MTLAEIKTRSREDTDQAARNLRPAQAFEEDRYHDYFRRLPFQALAKMLRTLGIDLSGKSVHVAGCGLGIDLFHLLQIQPNAEYFATDISADGVARTLQRFSGIEGQAEDMERLSFADNTFDWSFVAAAIHHLPRPALGVFELLRVSREGVIFIEPNDSWLVRMFVALRLAQEYEVHGNYVYRWSRSDVKKLCKSLYYDFECATLFATHRVARTRLEFEVLRGLNWIANCVAGRLGNYRICCIRKRQ